MREEPEFPDDPPWWYAQDASRPVVTTFRPTANGLGKLYRMEPGKRVVLDTIEDQWEWNDVEEIADQDARVSYSPNKRAHMRGVRDRVVRAFANAPLYAEKWKGYNDGTDPWLPYRMGRVR